MNGPWSGVLVPPLGSRPEMWLEAAGADYRVRLEPVFLRDGRAVENRFALVGLEPYGIVKGRYRPIQNLEVLTRALALTGEIAGLVALDGGKKFFVVVETGKVGPFGSAIVVQTSHDGTLPVTFAHVAHGYDFILSLGKSGGGSLRARHTPNLRDTIDEAKEVMAHHQKWRERTGRAVEHMLPPGSIGSAVSKVVKKRADELTDAIESRRRDETWLSGAVAVSRALDAWPGYGDAEGRLLASLDERSLLSRHKASIVSLLI